MQQVLITGGAGFIGSHLARRLLAEGARVRVLDNLDPFYDPALKRRNLEELAASGGERFTFHEGDLRDAEACRAAVEGADVVYARSWESLEDYGHKTLAASHLSRHTGWRIDAKLLGLGNDARLMHAMPIRRNVEVTDEILDGAESLVYQQAENRLHSQKALLLHLLR